MAFALPAQAATFAFSYTALTNEVLAGTVEGDLQADGDTIFVTGFGPVSFAGVGLSAIEPGEIRSGSDYPAGALQPVLSLSGSTMDIFVCAQGFDTNGDCSLANEGGFFIGTGFGFAAGDGQGTVIFESGTYDAARWSIAAAPIPVPPAAALLAGALAALGGLRRRRQARV
jgi:hypothetical protein